jgi:hypothetical protein
MIKKDKFFMAIILALMISNVFLIYFSFGKGPRHNQEPKAIIIEKLKLDDKQVQEYERLIEDHVVKVRSKEQKLMKIRKECNQLHKFDTSESALDSLTSIIGGIHVEIERINFEHIEDIKAICRKDQLASYNDLLNELGRLFVGPPRAKPGKK